MTKRTIFIGDVHGCIDELLELMERLAPTPEDRVIFVGDIINKGPDTKGVVEYVYGKGYECVLGNNEQSYIAGCLLVGSKYHQLKETLPDKVHEWIICLPRWIDDEHFTVVHAGLFPNMHPDSVPIEQFTRIRTWDGIGEDIQNSDNSAWYEFYTGMKPVIYGHWAAKGLNIRHNTIGLDSGCVYGGKLSAYILESNEIVQVPAKKIYKSYD